MKLTKDDWREFCYYVGLVGAALTAMLLCHAVANVVVQLVLMMTGEYHG